ncbi:uncharacterized protein [Palaemon carinicauda]|uniref:uncharacterized protein n=1 Tax=Palaemon carinicauda TaxID=392227 RepID=UPI0035B5EE6E
MKKAKMKQVKMKKRKNRMRFLQKNGKKRPPKYATSLEMESVEKDDQCDFLHRRSQEGEDNPQRNELRKHIQCKFYKEGRCRLGRECKYGHWEKKMVNKINYGKDGSKICRDYVNGACKRGHTCSFRHYNIRNKETRSKFRGNEEQYKHTKEGKVKNQVSNGPSKKKDGKPNKFFKFKNGGNGEIDTRNKVRKIIQPESTQLDVGRKGSGKPQHSPRNGLHDTTGWSRKNRSLPVKWKRKEEIKREEEKRKQNFTKLLRSITLT